MACPGLSFGDTDIVSMLYNARSQGGGIAVSYGIALKQERTPLFARWEIGIGPMLRNDRGLRNPDNANEESPSMPERITHHRINLFVASQKCCCPTTKRRRYPPFQDPSQYTLAGDSFLALAAPQNHYVSPKSG